MLRKIVKQDKKEVKTVVLKSNGLKCVKAYSQYIKHSN